MTTAVQYLLLFGATVYVVRLILVFNALLRQRVFIPRVSVVPVAEIPDDVRVAVADTERRLTELGLRFSHAQRCEAGLQLNHTLFELVFVHEPSNSIASVSPSGVGGRPQVEFVTRFEDTSSISTLDCLAHFLPPPPPGRRIADHYLGNLERQWQAHIDAIRSGTVSSMPMVSSPEAYAERQNQSNAATYAFRLKNGLIVETDTSGEARYSAGLALRWTPRVLRGMRRAKMALRRHGDKPVAGSQQTASDVIAYENMRAVQPRALSWIWKAGLSIGSGLLAVLVFGFTFSWETLPVLMGLVLFHEMGHLAGMKYFGCNDQQMLFLPLLGAVIIGDTSAATPRQKLIILALGPVPGLLLSAGAMLLYSRTGGELYEQIAVIAFALNAFNLLPILPLDGGQIVEILLFSRFPRARVAFFAISMLTAACMAWGLETPVLWAVAASSALGLQGAWRHGTAARLVAQSLPDPVDARTRTRVVFEVLSQPKFRRLNDTARIQLAKSLVEDSPKARPSLALTFGGGFAYVALMMLTIAAPIAYFWGSGGDRRGGLDWSSDETTHLARLRNLKPAPAPSRPYLCDGEPHMRPGSLSGAWYRPTIIGVFDEPRAAHLAAAAILDEGSAETVRVFGQSLFVTPADGGDEQANALERRVAGFTPATHVEDALDEQVSVVSISCKVHDDQHGAQLFDEIDSYAVHSRYGVRAPWFRIEDSSSPSDEAARVKRLTYRELIRFVALELDNAGFQSQVRAYEKARKADDAQARAVSRNWFDAQKAQLASRVRDHFVEATTPVDSALVAQYVAYLEGHVDDDQSYDFYWRMADPLGLEASNGTRWISQDGDPEEVLAAYAVGATVEDVRLAGRELQLTGVVFHRAAAGLPALVTYLCARQCSDIEYSIAPASLAPESPSEEAKQHFVEDRLSDS